MTGRNTNSVRLPKYQQIRSWLLEELSTQNFEIGDKFYSETRIAKKFKTAPMTVRKAFSLLESESFIRRKQGSGTFIKKIPSKPTRFKVTEHCNIGILILGAEERGNITLGPMFTELYKQFNTNGYMVSISSSIKEFVETQFDGIVVIGKPTVKELSLIRKSNLPTVGFGRCNIGILPCVYQSLDTFEKKVAFEFLKNGRRKIVVLHVGNKESVDYMKETALNPILNKIEHFGQGEAKFISVHSAQVSQTITELYSVNKKDRPDALLLLTWQSAATVLQILERLKIRIPEDTGLICHGGDIFSIDTVPPISMLKSNYKRNVKLVVEMLLKMIQDHSYKGEEIPNDAELSGLWTV